MSEAKEKTIKLTKPHEHAGRIWPVDSQLTMNASTADWLIAKGKGKEVTDSKGAK